MPGYYRPDRGDAESPDIASRTKKAQSLKPTPLSTRDEGIKKSGFGAVKAYYTRAKRSVYSS